MEASANLEPEPSAKALDYLDRGLIDEDEIGTSNLNWYEVRLDSKVPERRGYHSTFVYQNKLYIFGGHDIREGFLNNLWMIDMDAFRDFDLPPEEQDKSCGWQLLQPHGKVQPEAVSHHTSVVHGNMMYLFGGCLVSGHENQHLWALNIDKLQWQIVKPKRGTGPDPREEHTACVADGYMVIFGGFERGQRTNSIAMFHFETKDWTRIAVAGPEPPQRAGHSAVVYDGKMWIFGGKSNDNDKLLDLWAFDLAERKWTQIDFTMEDGAIASRSGHSACIYQDHMIIFAGIHEVTHELDDMAAYNFETKKWLHMFKEPNMTGAKQHESINQTKASKKHDASASSPGRGSESPTKKLTMASQKTATDKNEKSPAKTTVKKKKGLQQNKFNAGNQQAPSPKKKTEADPNDYSILSDVTSITMMSSILIKHAGPQFDNYHKAYLATKKQQERRTAPANGNGGFMSQPTNSFAGMGMSGSSVPEKNTYGKVEDRRPAARDGHSAVIHDGRFIVFGGDRHQMPFNDLHFLQLDLEFKDRGLA